MGRGSHNRVHRIPLRKESGRPPKGLRWSGWFCQVREIQQMQTQSRSQLMAEAADGRDGRSERRGGSTIDVIQSWTNDGAFGRGVYVCVCVCCIDQRPGSLSHLCGERARQVLVPQGGFSDLTPPCMLHAARRGCLGGVFVCLRVLACVHGCSHTYLQLSCVSTSAELCFLRHPWCASLHVCIAQPQSAQRNVLGGHQGTFVSPCVD